MSTRLEAMTFAPPPERSESLWHAYEQVRRRTTSLAAPLSPEDCVAQSMPDASPVKWHLAHTTWFFETFVLLPNAPQYQCFDSTFNYLFNSYYNAIGARHARPKRGLLTRPSLEKVIEYREYVDAAMSWLLRSTGDVKLDELRQLIVLGLNHEQQHQELLLTDVKHLLFQNPLRPTYTTQPRLDGRTSAVNQDWIDCAGGVVEIGAEEDTFAFDNELPRHSTYLQPFRLFSRLVTNREYLEFVEDGGYQRPELWLSDGWDTIRADDWCSPLYWLRESNEWSQFTLRGKAPLLLDAPVCHVSYYEADAYARWRGVRLPTEAEWEVVAREAALEGNLLESESFEPLPVSGGTKGPAQMFGDTWEWTQSAYLSYPGYRPAPGAIGEYNGKFMCNQMVLRGGSCFTPQSHIRPSYRNFFPPNARWQMTGIRLASGE